MTSLFEAVFVTANSVPESFRCCFFPRARGSMVDVNEWMLEGSIRKRLHDPRPKSEPAGGVQGAGRSSVDVSGRQRQGESHRHHTDCEKEEEDGVEEEQPFLTTADF